MTPECCPDAEQLRRLLGDQLQGSEAQDLDAHVEGCADCQQALEQLTAGAEQGTGLPAETVLAFLRRLEEGPPDDARALAISAGAARPPRRTREQLATNAPPPIPSYEVIRELGRGGMGVVYLARQVRLQRLVAIKMILAGGHAGEEELARFRAEAEAVARLQHPNVVQIHEVGEHDGRPFFVLEYVDGGSLERALAGTPQLARPAAQLVETLARAMHVAHQKGVVHRDLKPANVLMQRGTTKHTNHTKEGKDETEETYSAFLSSVSCLSSVSWFDSVPKITDFGLAKRLDVSLGATRPGAIMGTPSYMAPEQALGRNEEVGPAADTYALGAILYECLTGRPPFKGESPLDTLQQVVAREPIAPRQLQPKVPRDLETICLKCLRKDPHKRYATTLELADDLRRFLNHEPIRARPVGVVERLGRWCRRNPAVASLITALVVGTVGGLVMMTGLYLQAREQTRQTEVQRDRAEENFRLTLRVVEGYLTNVGESPELKAVGLEQLRQRLLGTAREFYERFARERGDDPQFRADLGDAYGRLGFISEELGEREKAAELYGRMQSVFAGLARDHPDHPDYRAGLAQSHHSLAIVSTPPGRKQEAEANYGEARRLLAQLVKDYPKESKYRAQLAHTACALATLHDENGRQTEAEASFREAADLRDQLVRADPTVPEYQAALAGSLANSGLRLKQRGELTPARESYEQARGIFARLSQAYPGLPLYRVELAGSHFHLAELDSLMGRKADAVQGYQRAVDLSARLAREHPYVLYYQTSLASSLVNQGVVHLSVGDLDRAEGPLQEARKLYARLRDAQPRVLKYGLELATACGNLGAVYTRKERRTEAEKLFLEARDLLTPYVRDHPELVAAQNAMANTCNSLGVHYFATGRHPEAEAAYLGARKAWEKLVQCEPNVLEHEHHLATVWLNLGSLYLRMARLDDAAQALKEARRIGGDLARQHPTVPELQNAFATSLTESGRVALAAGRTAEAEAAFQEACTTHEAMARRFPDVIAYKVEVAKNQYRVGLGYLQADFPARSLAWFDRAVQALEGLRQHRPKDAVILPALRNALLNRAKALKEQGRPADALKDCDRALKLFAGELRLNIRAWRTIVLVQVGEQALALTEAEELARTKGAPVDVLCSLARTHALIAAAAAENKTQSLTERNEQVERHSARAVELLGKLQADGYFTKPVNRAWLEKESDFQLLRGREGFQKLRRQIEEEAKATRE